MSPDPQGASGRTGGEAPGERAAGLSLRPVVPADLATIHGWIRQRDVQRWWGDRASAEAEVRLALESQAAICRMICLDRTPVGYAQAIDAGIQAGSARGGLGPGIWLCDLFIGTAEHQGKGHGQTALALIVDDVFSTTLAIACAIAISVRNERAARACEQIGFRWQDIAEDPLLGPCWTFVRERGTRGLTA